MAKGKITELRKAIELMRDFPMWLLNDIPERQPKYAYRSLLVIVPIALLATGFIVWCLVVLPVWIALPAAVLTIALSFTLVLHIVNRILPDHFPKDEDS